MDRCPLGAVLLGAVLLGAPEGFAGVLHRNGIPMANLTLVVDDAVLKRARQRALEEGTSVNAQVRNFLHRYAGAGSGLGGFLALTEGLGARSGPGGRTWRREDLHVRPGAGGATDIRTSDT